MHEGMFWTSVSEEVRSQLCKVEEKTRQAVDNAVKQQTRLAVDNAVKKQTRQAVDNAVKQQRDHSRFTVRQLRLFRSADTIPAHPRRKEGSKDCWTSRPREGCRPWSLLTHIIIIIIIIIIIMDLSVVRDPSPNLRHNVPYKKMQKLYKHIQWTKQKGVGPYDRQTTNNLHTANSVNKPKL